MDLCNEIRRNQCRIGECLSGLSEQTPMHTHSAYEAWAVTLWWGIGIRKDTTCRSISAMRHALIWQVTLYPDLYDLCGWCGGAYVCLCTCVLYTCMCHSYLLCVGVHHGT